MPNEEVQKVEPAGLEEHKVSSIEDKITGFRIKYIDTDMKSVLVYILNRLRESTTWVGIILSSIGIPAAIEEPVMQLVTAALSVIAFFIKEHNSPDSKSRNGGSSPNSNSTTPPNVQ